MKLTTPILLAAILLAGCATHKELDVREPTKPSLTCRVNPFCDVRVPRGNFEAEPAKR